MKRNIWLFLGLYFSLEFTGNGDLSIMLDKVEVQWEVQVW